MIRAIFFDLDGTLIDSVPGIVYSARQAVAQVAPHLQERVQGLRAHIGPPVRDILGRLLPELDAAAMDRVIRAFRTSYDSLGWQRSLLFDGVAAALEQLRRRGLDLFVVTNKPIAPTQNILNMLQLHTYFDEVLSPNLREPPFASKADMVGYILARRQLNPAGALLVGDSEDDAQAAAAARMRFVAVSYGYGRVFAHPEAHNVWAVVKDVAELVSLVDE